MSWVSSRRSHPKDPVKLRPARDGGGRFVLGCDGERGFEDVCRSDICMVWRDTGGTHHWREHSYPAIVTTTSEIQATIGDVAERLFNSLNYLSEWDDGRNLVHR